MCLIRVTATHDPPLELEAWKVFVVEPGGGLRSPFFRGDFVRDDYQENVWVNAGAGAQTFFNIEPNYRVGFHALADRAAAVELMGENFIFIRFPMVIRKVKLRGVHTSGEQSEGRCYVAQEMLLLPESEAGGSDDR